VSCHDPSNRAKASPLELFSYPNQALSGRHDLVRELSENAMPPATETTAPGIADPARREQLLKLARHFAVLGDAALAFDGEPPWVYHHTGNATPGLVHVRLSSLGR
jgi:hypothetical protein